jgi:hypothetical protein
VLNIDNWRRRVWAPAVEAAGVPRPARIYDLRSTFASDALAAGVSAFELARVMGTSVEMIERPTARCSTAPPRASPGASTRSTLSALGPRIGPRSDVWATIGPRAGPRCLAPE